MIAIADTGLLVALARQNDQYHEWAAENSGANPLASLDL